MNVHRQIERDLLRAAKSGNTAEVQRLLDVGDKVDETGEYGTALMYASQEGHPEICKLLIEKGADVNAQTKEGTTALMWASMAGSPDIAKLLIKAGADVNARAILDTQH